MESLAVPFSRASRRDDIDLGIADEAGHVAVGRLVIKLLCLRDLTHLAFQQDTDGICQRKRLGVVRRGEDERAPELALQALQLGPELDAEHEVEARERLVQQVEAWLAHHSAAERDALPLAAAEGRRQTVEDVPDLEQARDLVDPLGDLGLRHPGELERGSDVLVPCLVGVECEIVEDHRDVAPVGLQLGEVLPFDPDLARGRRLEAGDDPERGRLAGSGRAEEHDQRAAWDLQAQVPECLDRTEVLGDGAELQEGFVHGRAHALKRTPDAASNRASKSASGRIAISAPSWACVPVSTTSLRFVCPTRAVRTVSGP